MATTLEAPGERSAFPSLAERPRQWGIAQFLAVLGAFFVVVQIYVAIRYFARVGWPHQVTEFRDRDAASWWGARVYEVLSLVLMVVVLTWVIRGSRRARRLTFDAAFCIAGFLSFWIDPVFNILQPVFLFSSNFVNVENWLADMPLVLNPIAEQHIEAWLYVWPLYIVGFLLLAALVDGIMTFARRRWPALSRNKLIGIGLASGVFANWLLEIPIVLLKLYTYPGAPHDITFTPGAQAHPFTQWLVFGLLLFGPLGILRHFKNEQGQRLVERGLESYPPGVRGTITTLALTGLITGTVLVTALIHAGTAFYAKPYTQLDPPLPRDVIMELCDYPPTGSTGTEYGLCPGESGYQMKYKVRAR